MTNSITQAVDHAAAQSDRWLFLALLVLVMIAAVWLFRWLVNQFSGMMKSNGEIVERNTNAFHEMRTCMEKVSREIEYCRLKNSNGKQMQA